MKRITYNGEILIIASFICIYIIYIILYYYCQCELLIHHLLTNWLRGTLYETKRRYGAETLCALLTPCALLTLWALLTLCALVTMCALCTASGGVPAPELMTNGAHTRGFDGCLHGVSFGNNKLDAISESALSGVDVVSCSRWVDLNPMTLIVSSSMWYE